MKQLKQCGYQVNEKVLDLGGPGCLSLCCGFARAAAAAAALRAGSVWPSWLIGAQPKAMAPQQSGKVVKMRSRRHLNESFLPIFHLVAFFFPPSLYDAHPAPWAPDYLGDFEARGIAFGLEARDLVLDRVDEVLPLLAEFRNPLLA